MTSPYFIQPGQDWGQGLQALAGSVERYGQAKKQEEDQARVQKRFQDAQKAMSDAFASKDPNVIMQAVIDYPEIQKTAELMFGFTNDQSKEAAANTYRQLLADPQNAIQYLDNGIQRVAEVGGKPYNMIQDRIMFENDPEAALKAVKAGYAALDPEGYKAMFADKPEEMKVGRFRQITLPDGSIATLDTATNAVTPIDGGSAPQVDLSILPEDMQGPVSKQPVDTQRKIVESFATPGAIGKGKETEQQAAKAQEVTDKTRALVNELLSNESGLKSTIGPLDEITPNISASSRNAAAAMDDLKNLLTVENLKLMSGVLSESDIKILRSVGASGLSGSQERVIAKLKEMQKALNGQSSDEEQKPNQNRVKWGDM